MHSCHFPCALRYVFHFVRSNVGMLVVAGHITSPLTAYSCKPHGALVFAVSASVQQFVAPVLFITWSKVCAPACPAVQRGCSSVVMHIMSITYPQHAIQCDFHPESPHI
jgi:hypothetical protein